MENFAFVLILDLLTNVVIAVVIACQRRLEAVAFRHVRERSIIARPIIPPKILSGDYPNVEAISESL